MKCITLSSGKQVCFDSTPKAQTGLKATGSRFNFPMSKEQQLAQQARQQGDMPVAPRIVKAQEKVREQEAVKKKLANQPTVKLSDAQKKEINDKNLKQDLLAEMMSRNQQSLTNPNDRTIEADIAQDLNENGAMGLLDAPVKGVTALVTGRYQTPSQAIGRWANQNNHQMLRNAMIDDQFNPTGLGMLTDFGGETGLGIATGKLLGKASTVAPRLVKNSDDVPSNSGFFNLDKDPNVRWDKLTKEEVATLEKRNPNLFKVEQINEYSPEKIKQIKDAQQKELNLAREFTEKWGYQNVDELNRLEAHATSLDNQLQNATDANSRTKILKELLDTRQQIKDGKFIDPTFKEKVTKLFEEGNIANANSYMLEDPMYGPGLRDRSKLVYVNPNDPSINSLSLLDQDYIMNNFDRIGGARTNDATITIGSKPISAYYRKHTLTPNNQLKTEYILKQKTKYTPVNDTGFTGAHEGGHDLQNPFNWVEFFQEHDPKYNYYVGHDRNPVASRFKSAMVEPTVPEPDVDYTRESWLSGIGELHSNLQGERFKEVKDLMDYEGMSMDDAIKLLKTDPNPLLTKLINSDNSVSQHFRPTTSNEEKLDLLRMLPALGVGVLGVGAAAKSVGAKEPVQQKGGKNINNTGYLDNSDTKHNPYNIIPSNNITMDGVSIPLMLMPDGDKARVVMPNSGEYNFPNSEYVTEIPLAQTGRVNYSQPTSQDSLNVYNSQIALNKFYDKEVKEGRLDRGEKVPTNSVTSNFTSYIFNDPTKIKELSLKFYQDQIDARKNNNVVYDDSYNEFFNLTPKDLSKLEYEGLIKNNRTNPYQVYYKDLITPRQNLAAPFALYDSRIKPQNEIWYTPKSSLLSLFQPEYPGGMVRLFDYDPLAVKPFNMRTPQERIEWEKKYGKPQSKPEPEHVIVKSTTNKSKPTSKKSSQSPNPIYTSDPNDPKLKNYTDSLNLYNKGEKEYQNFLKTNRYFNIPAASTRIEYNPVVYAGNKLARIQPIMSHRYWYNYNPDLIAGTDLPSNTVRAWTDRYKKPVQPIIYKPQEKPIERTTLEPVESKSVPMLESNFEDRTPMNIERPTMQPSNQEHNRQYSITIPTIDIDKRQVAPRVNRVLGQNRVNPKNQYQRSINVDTRQLPIIDEYSLNQLRMKLGMDPKGFQVGGKTDDAAFKKFVSTLPPNLKNTGSDYNLRGYWESLGKPSSFDYSKPKQSDGMYHAHSRNDKTGEILKKPNHPSFGQALEDDRKLGYYPYQSPSGVIHTFKPNEVPQGFKVPIYPTLNNIKQFNDGGKNTKTIKLSSGKIITFK